jgi:hypothetical protein
MSDFWETASFKALQKAWYQTLKTKGFQDLETEDGVLMSWAATIFRVMKRDPLMATQKQEYYRLAGLFLHDYTFRNETEKYIWQLHSEGKSARLIVDALRRRGYKTYRTRVATLISELAKIMIRKY